MGLADIQKPVFHGVAAVALAVGDGAPDCGHRKRDKPDAIHAALGAPTMPKRRAHHRSRSRNEPDALGVRQWFDPHADAPPPTPVGTPTPGTLRLLDWPTGRCGSARKCSTLSAPK